jgi:hypothetical protein
MKLFNTSFKLHTREDFGVSTKLAALYLQQRKGFAVLVERFCMANRYCTCDGELSRSCVRVDDAMRMDVPRWNVLLVLVV